MADFTFRIDLPDRFAVLPIPGRISLVVSDLVDGFDKDAPRLKATPVRMEDIKITVVPMSFDLARITWEAK